MPTTDSDQINFIIIGVSSAVAVTLIIVCITVAMITSPLFHRKG